jgi:D-alanyl-D-alanine carboxypeptidase/D-alanyl-D-alanine-endopeptidase (penicillin-binding protein 4)
MSRALVPSLILLTSLSAGTGWAQVPDEASAAKAQPTVDGGVKESAKETPKETKETPLKGAEGKFAPTPVTPGPTGSPAEKQKWLQQQIDQLLSEAQLGEKTRVGIDVVDVETGKTLYARNDGGLFNPASNVKLFTTAAALALLGPEYRWKTVAYVDAPLVAGELKGRLYLKGHGDPTLVIEDLWRIVADLYAAGLRKVSGDLAVDDTFFDNVRVGPGFDQKQEDLPFRAPEGALSLNYNAVAVHVLPGNSDGGPARVVIDPQTPYFTITNEARTVAAGRDLLTVETHELADHTEVIVKGRVRLGDPAGQVQLRRVAHPDLYTAYAFKELLARHGIKVTGNVVREATPPTARALSAHYSQPLGVAVRDVNKRSNNFMAEQILKTLGAETGGKPGTWQKGLDAVSAFLERLGIAPKSYKMTNGSGLYNSNLFSPAQLTTLLRVAYKDFRFAADFIGSLALAGADGTIGHRMEGGLAERYVRAKTGTLAGVSCLAGYAGAPGHAPLAFAILMNDVPEVATQQARRAQDGIAEVLVAYLLAK